jgi:hypothetical protein
MIINNGTRWLPELETFGSSRGGDARQRRKLAISHDPSVGIQMVRKTRRRVESSVD